MTGWVWIDGAVVPADQARVSIWDRGFLYGDACFETLRVYDGRPFKLEAHLARLEHGMERLAFSNPPARETIHHALTELFDHNTSNECRLRITVTRGETPGGWSGESTNAPTLVIALLDAPLPAGAWYDQGRTAVWCDVPIMQAPWWVTDAKHANWLPRILAKPYVDAAGADEGFLRTVSGHLAEALTSNVFVVKGGVLLTPPVTEGILPGVTRALVLTLAHTLGIQAAQQMIESQTVHTADEVFVTNAGVGLAPVVRLEDDPIGAGTPGPIWRQLHQAYRREAGR